MPEYPLQVALKFHNAEHKKEEKRDKSPEGSQSLAAATTSGVEEAKRLAVRSPTARPVRLSKGVGEGQGLRQGNPYLDFWQSIKQVYPSEQEERGPCGQRPQR